jgi:NAD(P)-dependent dehydrogenase (short-subunit alcohol dehydrogenase family)
MVNNAGTPGPTGKIGTVTAQTLDTVLAVNVRAPFLMIREAVARMATDRGGAGGAIVNISSRAAELGGTGEWIHYAAKRCAGQPDDRCVEGVGGAWDPGERRQPLPDPDRPARPFRFTGRLSRLVGGVPMGRVGSTDEVATGVLWLLSPKASYITGVIVPISGGR